MTDLTDVSPGDIITSARQNLINDYIQDGTHKTNTLSLDIGGSECISSTKVWKGVQMLKYVGSSAEASISSSVVETTLGTVTIPASTVATGIIVSAALGVKGTTNDGIFRLKIGPTGSEALKQTVYLLPSTGDGVYQGGAALFYDSTQTWSSEVTVLLTGENSASGEYKTCRCYQMVVIGF